MLIISEVLCLNGSFRFRSELEQYCKQLVEPFTDIVSYHMLCTCAYAVCPCMYDLKLR